MVVVPKEAQIHGEDGIAQQFFELSLGAITTNNTGKRIFNAFLAVSSLGNIIVMTYTAARVKQEIAKEGILPAAKFFAQNTDMSLGRVLRWLQRKGQLTRLLRYRWLSPEEHSEKTPVGAFVLHLIACLVLIFATWDLGAGGTYNLLSNFHSYVINGIFGFFLGVGILILRFRGPPATEGDDASRSGHAGRRKTWAEMTGKRFNPVVSVVCAIIYIIGNLWPIVAAWIKPEGDMLRKYTWWIMPTIAWTVVCIGALWFVGFVAVAYSIDRKHHKVFVVEKKPEFESADGGDGPVTGEDAKGGGLVMVHETVYLSWVGRETLRLRQPQEVAEEEAWHGRPF
jgi:amino acid transporter